jgi:hypothetical protein
MRTWTAWLRVGVGHSTNDDTGWEVVWKSEEKIKR